MTTGRINQVASLLDADEALAPDQGELGHDNERAQQSVVT